MLILSYDVYTSTRVIIHPLLTMQFQVSLTYRNHKWTLCPWVQTSSPTYEFHRRNERKWAKKLFFFFFVFLLFLRERYSRTRDNEWGWLECERRGKFITTEDSNFLRSFFFLLLKYFYTNKYDVTFHVCVLIFFFFWLSIYVKN